MAREPILLCWSGGKDSARALLELARSEEHEVRALLTTVAAPYQRVSMHGVRRTLLESQAAELGLELQVVEIPAPCPDGAYELAMERALAPWRAAGLRRVAFGDLFLEDVRRYREERLARVAMEAVFPLWGRDTAELARSFLALGHRAVVTCVDPAVLDASACGRAFDAAFLDDLPPGADPSGENGEFHTFVWDGPLFRAPVRWTAGETVVRDGYPFRDLVPV